MFDQLKKWIIGDANLKAEQQLQEQAKKDELLRDAMEGYQSMPEADHAESIDKLKTQLQDRYKEKSKKRGGAFSWSTVASAAAFILAIAIFYWTQREIPRPGPIVENTAPEKSRKKDNDLSEITKEETKSLLEGSEDESLNSSEEFSATEPPIQSPKEQAPITSTIRKDREDNLKIDQSNIEAGIMEEQDLKETDDLANLPQKRFQSIDDAIVADESIEAIEPKISAPVMKPAGGSEEIIEKAEGEADYVQAAPAPEITLEAKEIDKISANEPASFSTTDASNSINTNALKGTVVDLNTNEVLIGASVLIQGTNDGAVTDIDGRFSLNSSEPLPWTLEISYTGFSNQEVVVNDIEEDLQVVLDDSGAVLSEVVVTGYSTRRSKKEMASVSSSKSSPKVKPKGGKNKMKRYIRKNLEYPSMAKDQSIEGTVTVRFYINDSGQPEQLSIVKSLQNDCDQEAIRLIQEGPKWEPKNTWTTYDIQFKL